MWDLETGRAARALEGHAGQVNGVAVTPDGKRAVSASVDGKLKVWNLDSGCALRTLECGVLPVTGVAVTADGERATSVSQDKTLKVWDLATGRLIVRFHCDGSELCSACAAPNRIVAGDHRGRVYFLALEE